MRNYITVDGLKYVTSSANWRDGEVNPRTVTRLLSGAGDATFSNSTYMAWKGEIECPVTPRSAGWGTLTTLQASFRKKTVLSFEDHYGTAYTVTLGPMLDKRSLLPIWDDPNNKFFVTTEIFTL